MVPIIQDLNYPQELQKRILTLPEEIKISSKKTPLSITFPIIKNINDTQSDNPYFYTPIPNFLPPPRPDLLLQKNWLGIIFISWKLWGDRQISGVLVKIHGTHLGCRYIFTNPRKYGTSVVWLTTRSRYLQKHLWNSLPLPHFN